jgi:parvulin-like peptidyl-prolyl isomerase
MRTETQIFIVLFILVILFCLAYNQEGFAISDDRTVQNIASFLGLASGNINSPPNTPEEEKDYKAILAEIKTLNTNLQLVIQQNAQNNQLQSSVPIQANNLEQVSDIRATQIIQDSYINDLQTRLDNLNQVYQNYLQKKNSESIKYDKIPVYSSCIISEANGQYTLPSTTP